MVTPSSPLNTSFEFPTAGERPLTGRTILGVFAHPDDESLACGGTIARAADLGARVILLCASRGEAGTTCDPALVADGDLAGVRTNELREAAAVLGVAEVLMMDHPDGDLRWIDVPELHAEIVAALERFKPDAVITFAEDGLYWHLDHIGVHERTCTAVGSLGPDAPPLYYVTIPHGVMRQMFDAARSTRGAPPEPSFWGITPDAFGALAQPATFVVDARPWIHRKLAALRCHRTQMGSQNPIAWIDEDDARRWLGIEHFRRAPLEGRRDFLLEQLGEPVASS